MRFFDFLFPPRHDEAILRNISDSEFFALSAPGIVPYTRPATAALLPFSDAAVRAAIHEAKYHGSERAFSLLAAVLADYVRDLDEVRGTCALLPVPLGDKRRKERGLNQVEEVVRRAAAELNLPIATEVLARVRETASQVALSRSSREENVRGAFRTLPALDVSCTYIIVDDVLTTGATLQAVIDTLQRATSLPPIPISLTH